MRETTCETFAFRFLPELARNILFARLGVNAQVKEVQVKLAQMEPAPIETHLPTIRRFDMVPTMDEANVSLTSCPKCAAQMPATAVFCPGCGGPTQTETRAYGSVGVLRENIAGVLAYFTVIPAIVFLVLEPYSKNRFVRFHSVQCVLLWAAAILFAIALKLASVVLFIIPVLGPLLVYLVSTVVALAAVVIWVVLVVKAFQGEMFKLPLLGDFASQHADS
jgi:uncharacterized membrane protein